MPTQAESDYELKKDRYRRAVDDFISDRDNMNVFRARLHGIGYRGAEITTEVDLALMTKAERAKPKKYSVIIMAKGRPLQSIPFDTINNAEQALRLLRKQSSVRLAYFNAE